MGQTFRPILTRYRLSQRVVRGPQDSSLPDWLPRSLYVQSAKEMKKKKYYSKPYEHTYAEHIGQATDNIGFGGHFEIEYFAIDNSVIVFIINTIGKLWTYLIHDHRHQNQTSTCLSHIPIHDTQGAPGET